MRWASNPLATVEAVPGIPQREGPLTAEEVSCSSRCAAMSAGFMSLCATTKVKLERDEP
jgi:hypothetical protein